MDLKKVHEFEKELHQFEESTHILKMLMNLENIQEFEKCKGFAKSSQI